MSYTFSKRLLTNEVTKIVKEIQTNCNLNKEEAENKLWLYLVSNKKGIIDYCNK